MAAAQQVGPAKSALTGSGKFDVTGSGRFGLEPIGESHAGMLQPPGSNLRPITSPLASITPDLPAQNATSMGRGDLASSLADESSARSTRLSERSEVWEGGEEERSNNDNGDEENEFKRSDSDLPDEGPAYQRGHRPSLMVSQAGGFGKRISINYAGNQYKKPFKAAPTSRVEVYDKDMFPKMKQISQQVYQTFMIKSIRNIAEGDFDMVMVGTVIQRVINDPRIVRDQNNNVYRFVYDLNDEDKAICGAPKLLCEENPLHRPFFTYRINEIYHDVTDNIRKVTIVGCSDSTGVLPCSVTNMSVEFPCTMHSAFNGKPYQILTCECLIELTSRYCGDHEYRPNLMANKTGMDNICCVRDETRVDELYAYDPMWPYPTIEIPNEGKIKGGTLVNYTPKMLVYFYMTTSPMDTFIRTFLPILFATVAQTMNCLHDVRTRYGSCEWIDAGGEDGFEPEKGGWYRRNFHGNLRNCVKDVSFWSLDGRDVSYESPAEYDSRSEFLQVTVSIGLAVIFILPQISDDAMSNEHVITMNEIYIMIFFAGLIVGCIDGYYPEIFSYVSMWFSLLIPVSSMVRYNLARGYILSDSVNKLKRGASTKAKSKSDTVYSGEAQNSRRTNGDSGSARSSSSRVMNKSGADVNGNDLCEFFMPGLTGKDVTVNKAILGTELFPSAVGTFSDNQLWYSIGHRKDAMDEDAKASKIRNDAAVIVRSKTHAMLSSPVGLGSGRVGLARETNAAPSSSGT